jgi:hypothetical protein
MPSDACPPEKAPIATLPTLQGPTLKRLSGEHPRHKLHPSVVQKQNQNSNRSQTLPFQAEGWLSLFSLTYRHAYAHLCPMQNSNFPGFQWQSDAHASTIQPSSTPEAGDSMQVKNSPLNEPTSGD